MTPSLSDSSGLLSPTPVPYPSHGLCISVLPLSLSFWLCLYPDHSAQGLSISPSLSALRNTTGSTAFPRATIIPLALSNNIAPSLSVSLSLPVFRVKKRSISYLRYSFLQKRSFSSLLPRLSFPSPILPSFRPPLPYHFVIPLLISEYRPLCPSRGGPSLPLPLALSWDPLLRPWAPFSSPHSLTRLTSLAFPPRHLPRAILPPSTRLAHPAVVSLRYSPFCPRGTSNAEAQVCKMAAARWSSVRRGRCFALTGTRKT